MDKIVVITIIAVFWLFGLLTAWSMCVVAARADRRMEENRHARQRIQTRRLEHQSLTGAAPTTRSYRLKMAEPMGKTAESFFLFRTGNGCFQFFRNVEECGCLTFQNGKTLF